jgi:hypothetical protein
MSHSPPPVPVDQRSPGPNAHGESAPNAQAHAGEEGDRDAKGGLKGQDGRNEVVDVASPDPGDADVNTSEQGRFGDIKQNTTHQGLQQDR